MCQSTVYVICKKLQEASSYGSQKSYTMYFSTKQRADTLPALFKGQLYFFEKLESKKKKKNKVKEKLDSSDQCKQRGSRFSTKKLTNM